jgi:hypothetical protein
LYLLDLAQDRSMDGAPLARVFKFKNQIRYAVYRKKSPLNRRQDRELDEKALEDLKALGYIN